MRVQEEGMGVEEEFVYDSKPRPKDKSSLKT